MENKDYVHKSDEELALLSKAGDDNAVEELFSRYTGVVKQTARSFFLFGGDASDVIQEGMLGLYKAVKGYNQQSSFKTFASLCIKRNIISAVKSANSKKHTALNNYVDFSSVDSDDGAETYLGDTTFDPAEMFDERESKTELTNKLKSILSEFEYEILRYYLDGYSYSEISDKTGRQVKAIDNAVQRIRKKICNNFKK
jgi:RNA polymerase sporulation-specific sigma factor